MSLKREENTDEKVARPSVKRIPHGADTSDPIADSAECPDQKIVVGTLEDIADLKERFEVKPPSTIIVEGVVNVLLEEDYGIDGNYLVVTLIFTKYGNLPLCLDNYALFSLPLIFTTSLYTYPLSNIIYLG